MQMVESEFKISIISKTICLSFNGFNFIDSALHRTTCDPVREIVQYPLSMGKKSQCHFYQWFDARIHRVKEPLIEKCKSTFTVGALPETAQLLFHGVHDIERLVDIH